MIKKLIEKLKTVNPWHLLWIGILSSEVLTALLSITASYAMWGGVSREILIIGAIDAFAVSLVVVFTVIFFVREYRVSQITNIQLMKEIEERKKAEEEKGYLYGRLQQAQKMEAVGRLAGGVAHDFNNILSIIIGYCDISLMMLPKDHPLVSKIKLISESGFKAAALTRQLLAFSRKQVLQMQVRRPE